MIVSYSILGGVKTIGIVARILLKLNRFDDFGFLGYVTAENRSVPRAIRGLIVSPSKQLSRNTHTHTHTITKSCNTWICRRGESMVEETRCSLALALSFREKTPSKWWWVWKERNWIKRGIVKSVGSHRIVVTVKRSRLTTHGDCLTSSRLDWSWPAGLCSTALDSPMHPPKMHSTVVKAATLVPHV